MTRKKLAILLCLVVLISAVVVNTTVAYLSDSDQKLNVFKMGDVEVTLDEPEWDDPTDGAELRFPGDIKYKNPTVTAETGDVYFRILMEIVKLDEFGALTDDLVSDDAAELILNTLYFEDPRNDLAIQDYDEENHRTGTSGLAAAELQAYAHFNADCFKDITNVASLGVKYYLYVDDNDDCAALLEGESAVLFNTVVIPADYGNAEFAVMGDYAIKITVQAVQAANIAADGAADVLENEFPGNA